jgi:hypothetical protein
MNTFEAPALGDETRASWRTGHSVTLCMDKFVHLIVRWHGKMHIFLFSVHFNQACDLSCANIAEMMAESDPIFVPDISISIFFVTLDYDLMNPVLIR